MNNTISTKNQTSTKTNDALIQVRVPADLKERTSKLFRELGTNTSTVINMMLVQADKNQCIPFEIKTTGYPISANDLVDEVSATMDIESMPLSDQNLTDLNDIAMARKSTEEIRKKTITKYQK